MTGGLGRTRIVAAALAGAPAAFALLAVSLPADLRPVRALAFPAALLGLVAPAAAYRVYGAMRDGAGDPTERLFRATVTAMAVTEGAAIFGCVAFVLSREWASLAGVATHLVLAGAVWPTEARFESFGAGGGGSR